MGSYRTRTWVVLLVLLPVLVFPQIVSAQTTATCQEIVDETIQAMGTNCANSETGFACFASPELTPVFVDGFDPELFDEPGERIDLADLVRVTSEASSRADEAWGVTVYNIQASLPSGFPNDVIVVAFGEVELENGVEDDLLFLPLAEPLALTTSAASELRLATLTPPAVAELVGNAPAGSSVLVDALSEDGDWVRGIFDEGPVWFQSSAFNSADLIDLPVLEVGDFSPYQRFYTATGGAGDCADAQPMIMVQGPQDTAVDLAPNGIPVRLESTMMIRTFEAGFPVGRTMEITVLRGVLTINPDTANPIYVPAGFRILIGLGPELLSLGNEGDVDERGGPYTYSEPVILSQPTITSLSFLSRLPANILNYVVQLPQIIIASGIGGPLPQIIFQNPAAANVVQRYCDENRLPAAICATFGF